MNNQAAFATALYAPDRPAPEGLHAPEGHAVATRFNVYRNNVIASLIEALQTAFPVVRALVGDDFFVAMARAFVADHPPDSPLVTFYGGRLAGWLENFEPVASLPYLPEMARLEHARILSCHARDVTPLDPLALQLLGAEALVGLQVLPHPSVCMVETAYPTLAIWARNTGDAALSEAKAGPVLICRPHWQVQLHKAPEGVRETLAALAAGEPLGAAIPSGCDAAAVFACLFSAGALIAKDTTP